MEITDNGFKNIYIWFGGGVSGIIDVPGSAFMFQLKKYALPFPKYMSSKMEKELNYIKTVRLHM